MRKFLRVNNKIVGDYDDEKRTYFKLVKRSEHLMRKFEAYGIQDTVIQELKALGCERVVITEADTKQEYVSHFWDWLHVRPKDFGHGKQRFLQLKDMKHYYLVPDKEDEPT